MPNNVLLFAHADGDGHLAAEQSRRNLAEKGDSVKVIVDPQHTRSWRFWQQHFPVVDFGDAETVYIVDIMLSPKDPFSSYMALCERAKNEPDRRFVFIDHHPVNGLPKPPKNLKVNFVDSVYECCVGSPSDLMVIASICDPDEEPVKARITSKHRLRALGLKRAVSERQVLAGDFILSLLKKNLWEMFEQLAGEPARYHRTFYGNRVDKIPLSPILQTAFAKRG